MKSDEEIQQEERLKRIDQQAAKVNALYDMATGALITLAIGMTIKPNKPFKFANYSQIADKVDSIFAKFYDLVFVVIQGGIKSEWHTANKQMDAKVLKAFGKIDVRVATSYFNHNEGAMQAFLNRAKKDGGLGLSERVWQCTGQLRPDLEAALQVGIAEGKSAQQLARQVRKYLQNPDGLLLKSKQLKLDLFKEISQGRGVYRSAVKNAMRLTRTELNMAYHSADHERRQQLDIIVGYEVHTSSNHPVPDICDTLAGKYPKTFKFVSWHPVCMCYTTDILCTDKELDRLSDALLNGREVKGFKSINQVKNVPDNFTEWIDANRDRVATAKSIPYFIRDNIGHIPTLK